MSLRILLVVVAAGALWAVSVGHVRMPATAMQWMITAVVAAAVLYPLLRWVGRLGARYTLTRQVAALTQRQMTPLLRRRAQLVTLDPYGKPQFARWEKEIDYFVAEHIAPSLTAAEQASLARSHDRIAAAVFDQVEAAFTADAALPGFSDEMTPVQYETFCAQQLNHAGWSARVTMQSRDQGVDVVAEKDRRRLVLQCKLYSRPVGNKSVQEVAAARAHEDADFAVVVSNNRFTPAAEQLAATNGVLLLHHRDLAQIDAILAERR